MCTFSIKTFKESEFRSPKRYSVYKIQTSKTDFRHNIFPRQTFLYCCFKLNSLIKLKKIALLNSNKMHPMTYFVHLLFVTKPSGFRIDRDLFSSLQSNSLIFSSYHVFIYNFICICIWRDVIIASSTFGVWSGFTHENVMKPNKYFKIFKWKKIVC